jgi:hypothetical protein
MASKVHRQAFRHRGFENKETGEVIQIYGNDEAPRDSAGKPLKKLWDHDVEQVSTVTDHIEPKTT